MVKVFVDFRWIVFDLLFFFSFTWEHIATAQHAYAHLAHSNPVEMEWNGEWKNLINEPVRLFVGGGVCKTLFSITN